MVETIEKRSSRLSSFLFSGYRALWGAVFVLALAFTCFIHPRDEIASQAKYRALMRVGFSAWWNPVAEGQRGGPFADVGRRAGLAFGDILYAIDGRPLPADTAGRTAAAQGPEGSIATLSLRRPDGSEYVARIPRSDRYEADAYRGSGITFSGRRWAVFVVDTLARLASLAAALLLFLRRPRDPVAGILSGALVFSCFHSINVSTTMPGVFGVVETIINDLAVPIAILLFPRGRLTTIWHWLALLLILANEVYSQTASSTTSILTFGNNLMLIAAVTAQFRATPAGSERQQIKFVLFGVVLSMLITIGANWIDAIMYRDIPEGYAAWLHLSKWTLYALGNLALAGGLLVSLVRYRLYDADTAIARSIAYGALTVLLLAAFAASEKLIEALGEAYFGDRLGAFAGGLGAAIAAVLIVPMHHRVSHWVEHRVQKHLIKLRHGLPLLVGDLRETADQDQITAIILDHVTDGVRASRAAVVVDGAIAGARGIDAAKAEAWRSSWMPASAKSLNCDRRDTVFPVRVPLRADGHGLVGWLLLGPRPDGSLYGREERQALDEIADPVARALQVVNVRTSRDAQLDGVIRMLTQRLEAAELAFAQISERRQSGLEPEGSGA